MNPSRAAATAALYNVALQVREALKCSGTLQIQVAFRGISFGLNAYVLQCTTAEILGTVNVR
jgi:hypothetical protein